MEDMVRYRTVVPMDKVTHLDSTHLQVVIQRQDTQRQVECIRLNRVGT